MIFNNTRSNSHDPMHNLITAHKRAVSMGIEGDVQFKDAVPIVTAWKNVQDMCNASSDYLDKLHSLDWWAQRINQWCDANMIKDNFEVRVCLFKFKQELAKIICIEAFTNKIK